MKFLVLGSSGQIGSHLCSYLRQWGHSVIECDIKNGVEQDLRNPNSTTHIRNCFRECDFVFFLASDVGGAKYLEKNEHSYSFIQNNMKIMTNVFGWLKDYGKPFIFTSSQMAELPYSTYGTMKLLGEKMTKEIGGLPVRLWNVYGPEKDEEKAHVITDFCKMAKEGIIKMRTTGSECRQFLYVDDCCDAFLSLAKDYNNLDKSKNYHITSFEWNHVSDIANILQSMTGCEIVVGEKFDETQKNAMNNADSYILNFCKPKTRLCDVLKKIYFG
jgi:nucleoside-diphosphate-sugar epimerase